MGRLKFLPLFLSLAASSACSQNPVVPTPEATHQQPAGVAQPAGNAKEEAPKPAPVASNLPKQELTPDVLYEFLVSEIAGQRGMLSTAKEGYLDLAKKTQDPRLAQRAAEIAVFTRDQPAALEASKLWVKLDPNTPRASQTVAALLLGQGKIDEAIPYLESYLKGEEGPSAFLHLPMMFSKVKDTDKALEAVKKLAQNYPQSPEAQYAIAQTAANAGKTDEALDALTRADKLRPGWEPAALMRSQLLARRSKAEGLAFMKDFIASHPQARDVRLAYARLLVNANQYAEARQQFNELMTELPANPDITLASGLLALQTADLAEAERLLLKARDLNYKEPETISYYLGQIAEERKQLDRAMEQYQSVEEGEFMIPARSREAGILAHQGKLAEARKLLAETPTMSDIQRIQLVQAEADLLRDAHDYAGVFAVLSEALEKFPDALDLLYDRAMAAERINKLDVMEQDLRKVIRIKPDYAHAYNALGYTLADRTDRLAEAEELLNKALTLAPDDPFILDSMGWLQYRKGNLAKSQEYLERAYKDRRDPEIAAHLGEVLWMKGAKDEADKLWHTSLQNNPQNEALIETLKKFNKH
jgi:tetratricopeptide (TPR) repeat protein